MIKLDELEKAFHSLPTRGQPVIAHASYRSFGAVDGGPATVIEALVRNTSALVMPAFTYDTMVTPLVGPPNNGIDYRLEDAKRRALEAGQEYVGPATFRSRLPVDQDMGVLPETLRRRPDAKRSLHPILSFTGVNADFALDRQTIYDPFAPIAELVDKGGWVMLIGVDHKVNTSIHYAEKLAGRKQFVRWALTPKRIVECPGFPGDSYGFDAIADEVKNFTDSISIGQAHIEVLPLKRLIDKAVALIQKDSKALLCNRPGCERCEAVLASLS